MANFKLFLGNRSAAGGAVVVDLLAASLTFAAQSISQRITLVLLSNTLTTAAQVIALGIRNTLNVGGLTLAAQGISQRVALALSSSAVSTAAQAVVLGIRNTLSAASLVFVAAAITASGALEAFANRWRAINSVIRGVIRDPEDE